MHSHRFFRWSAIWLSAVFVRPPFFGQLDIWLWFRHGVSWMIWCAICFFVPPPVICFLIGFFMRCLSMCFVAVLSGYPSFLKLSWFILLMWFVIVVIVFFPVVFGIFGHLLLFG